MRNILLVVGLAGVVGFAAACGGGGHPDVVDSGNAGSAPRGGRSSGGKGSVEAAGDDAGGAGGMGEMASNAPLVKITSPTESLTPDDGVLVDQTAHVVCTVIQSTAPDAAAIDPTSVSIALSDSMGKVLDTRTASATKNDDEYATDFVLATVPSGPISFTCTGSDKNKVKGNDKISTFVDHGPTITVISPLNGSAHPLKGGLDVQFIVEPTPLVDGDSGADVDTVVFTLDGKVCDVPEISKGKYQTSLALDDTNKFPVPPNGAVKITAKNKRSPAPATATDSYEIVVDGAGPLISIQSPAPQSVVGGKVTLAFTVTDKGSGVDEKSVTVALFAGDTPRPYDPTKGWSHVGDKFTFTFDTKDIEPDAPVQTTINVRASDNVANPSASGQSLQLYFDNVPPQIDIDPKNIRLRNGNNCSGSFDPVGNDVVNDLDGQVGEPIVNPIAYFRVFVDERTNSQPGQLLHYYSGTNQGEVRLYIQADPENAPTKLLVGKNPAIDNTCDDIGGVDDPANPPLFSSLQPINANSAVGVPWNQKDPTVAPDPGACLLSDSPEPVHLCPSHLSDLWYVPFNAPIKEPYVYVVGTPLVGDNSCAGIDLAFLTAGQKDGWVCAAARVVDKAGNVGISPPIRLCVDDGKDPPPACRISSTIPPTCTDGCTPPARGGGFFVSSQ